MSFYSFDKNCKLIFLGLSACFVFFSVRKKLSFPATKKGQRAFINCIKIVDLFFLKKMHLTLYTKKIRHREVYKQSLYTRLWTGCKALLYKKWFLTTFYIKHTCALLQQFMKGLRPFINFIKIVYTKKEMWPFINCINNLYIKFGQRPIFTAAKRDNLYTPKKKRCWRLFLV